MIICDTGALVALLNKADDHHADASVVAVAERLNTSRVATLDQRHFRTVRSAHCPSFELLPSA